MVLYVTWTFKSSTHKPKTTLMSCVYGDQQCPNRQGTPRIIRHKNFHDIHGAINKTFSRCDAIHPSRIYDQHFVIAEHHFMRLVLPMLFGSTNPQIIYPSYSATLQLVSSENSTPRKNESSLIDPTWHALHRGILARAERQVMCLSLSQGGNYWLQDKP